MSPQLTIPQTHTIGYFSTGLLSLFYSLPVSTSLPPSSPPPVCLALSLSLSPSLCLPPSLSLPHSFSGSSTRLGLALLPSLTAQTSAPIPRHCVSRGDRFSQQPCQLTNSRPERRPAHARHGVSRKRQKRTNKCLRPATGGPRSRGEGDEQRSNGTVLGRMLPEFCRPPPALPRLTRTGHVSQR